MSSSLYFREMLLRHTILDSGVFPRLFLSLHDEDPGEFGASEIDGLSYERQVIVFGNGSSQTSNVNLIEYDWLPASRISHYGIWDSVRGGRYLLSGELEVAQALQEGQALRWRPDELIIRIG